MTAYSGFLTLALSLASLLASACSESSRPSRTPSAVNSTRQSADNSPVRFTLIDSRFQRCEKAGEGGPGKGLRKTLRFSSASELELTLEMTPDASCKLSYSAEELATMEGRVLVPGRYEKKSSLEGIFHLETGGSEENTTGNYKISGMSLKLVSSSSPSQPDTYLFVE